MQSHVPLELTVMYSSRIGLLDTEFSVPYSCGFRGVCGRDIILLVMVMFLADFVYIGVLLEQPPRKSEVRKRRASAR